MSASGGTAVRDDRGVVRVIPAAMVDALPWDELPNLPGVAQKVLWQAGDIVVGLVRVEPGAAKPGHRHYLAQHHIWIVSGSCTMVGQPVSAGAYLYIPPGVEHEVADVGPDGCVYFYTHRPMAAQPLGEAQLAGAIGVE